MSERTTLAWPEHDGSDTTINEYGCSWTPSYSQSSVLSEVELSLAIARALPSQVRLLHLSERAEHMPPQEWWDETTDPFAPHED